MSIRTLLIQGLITLSLLTLVVGRAQATNNTVLGPGAGANLQPDAHDNTLIGPNAGAAITTSDKNTLVGAQAGQNTTAFSNTLVGHQAGLHTSTGCCNAFFGNSAGFSTTTGSNNTYLGWAVGTSSRGSGNVFVGSHAGADELGSDKLYIDNQSDSFPLIYGEFENIIFPVGNRPFVAINGDLGVGTQIPMAKLHVYNGNLRIERPGAINATLNFIANGNTWEIKNNQATGRLTFFSPGGGATTASFKFDRQAVENLLRVGVLGPSIVDVNGDLMVTGNITNPDYVFTPEYSLESIEDHAAYMWEHQHLPAVGAGQVNAQGQGMVNVGQRSQGMLEELEKAHIYIEQLHGEMNALKDEVAVLKEKEAQLESLKREMTALKALVNQLVVQDRAAVPGKEG